VSNFGLFAMNPLRSAILILPTSAARGTVSPLPTSCRP
jgi:hypothetical protein